MHIWWLGQSGFLVQMSKENILLDPYLSDSLSETSDETGVLHERITGLVVEPAGLSFVDVVTSSHSHLDHLDPGTLPDVLSGGAAFVCAAGSEIVATERAGRAPDVALHVGELATFAGFQIEAVPAYHDDAPEAVGYVVRNGTYCLLPRGRHAAGAGNRRGRRAEYGVDVAFVPINGKHGNMDGADAARLAYEAGAHDRDPVPLRDVPAQHRQHLALRRRVRPARARSTACRGPASGSRSTTASEPRR